MCFFFPTFFVEKIWSNKKREGNWVKSNPQEEPELWKNQSFGKTRQKKKQKTKISKSSTDLENLQDLRLWLKTPFRVLLKFCLDLLKERSTQHKEDICINVSLHLRIPLLWLSQWPERPYLIIRWRGTVFIQMSSSTHLYPKSSRLRKTFQNVHACCIWRNSKPGYMHGCIWWNSKEEWWLENPSSIERGRTS